MHWNLFDETHSLKVVSYFLFAIRRYDMKYEKFDKNTTFEICDLFQMLYKGSNGFIKIMSQGNRKGYFYNTETLCDQDKLYSILNSHRFRKNNLYISLGTYKTMENARQDNLLTINALALDVDYTLSQGQECMTYAEASKALESAILDKFPVPTHIEHSRNMRLVYILNQPYILKKGKSKPCRDFLCRVTKMLCENLNGHTELIQFNATPHRLTSFLRVPYSTNLRYLDPYDPFSLSEHPSGIERYPVDFDLTGPTWDIDKLAECVLPEKFPGYEDWKRRKTQSPCHIYIVESPSFCEKRLKELQALQSRGYDIGYRERLCYLYWITARQNGMNADESIATVKEYNQRFRIPLEDHRLLTDCKPSPYIDGKTGLRCEGWERHFTDKSIREFLGIGNNEPGNSDKCKRYKEKKRAEREAIGDTKKQQIEQQVQTIAKLRAAKQTWQEIANYLNISLRTAKRYGERLKELEKGA